MENVKSVLETMYPASFQFTCARGGDPISTLQGLQDSLQKLTIENNDRGAIVEIVGFQINTFAEPVKNVCVINGNGQPQVDIYFLATAVVKIIQVQKFEDKNDETIDPYLKLDLPDPGDR